MIDIKEKYQFLRFIEFGRLQRWDYNSFFNKNSIKSKYDIVELKDILSISKKYELLESEKEYKLLGVKSYGNGCFFREEKLGKNIKAKQLNKVNTDQFIYSRLGANIGGLHKIYMTKKQKN
jgi:hypothetical protein